MGILDFLSKLWFPIKPQESITQWVSTAPELAKNLHQVTDQSEKIKQRSKLEQYIKGWDNQVQQLFDYLKDFDLSKIDGSFANYYAEELEWFYHVVTSDDEKMIAIRFKWDNKSLDEYIKTHHTNSEKYLEIKKSIEQLNYGHLMRDCANLISHCLQVAKRNKDDITPKNITQYNILVMFIYGLALLDRDSPILIDPTTKKKVEEIS